MQLLKDNKDEEKMKKQKYRSEKHNIFTEEIDQIALHSDDHKIM